MPCLVFQVVYAPFASVCERHLLHLLVCILEKALYRDTVPAFLVRKVQVPDIPLYMNILLRGSFPEYNPVRPSGFTDDVFPVSYIEDIGVVSPASLQAVVS